MASFKSSLSRLGKDIARSVNHSVENMKSANAARQSRAASREAPRYSKGVRELNDQGYEVYNIGEDSEIFIARTPDMALFDDGDPVFVSGDDMFVGKVDEAEPVVQAAEVETPQVDAMSFFANVPRGSSEVEVHGQVGVYNGGHVEPVMAAPAEAPVQAVPAQEAPVQEASGNIGQEPRVSFEAVEAPVQEAPKAEPVKIPDFMNRIKTGARPAPKPVETPAEIPAEVPVEAAPIEAPVEEIASEVIPVETPVEEFVEVPVEQVPVEAAPIEAPAKAHEEFFIDAETPVEEAAESPAEAEDSDYDWMFEADEPAEVPVEAAPVEAPVEEVPVEVAPVEAVPMAVPVEAPVEAPVEDDVDVDAIVGQIVAEEVAKQVAVEKAVSSMVAKPSVPATSFVVEELAVTEEASVAGASAIPEPVSVETSVEAEAPAKAVGFDADGEALPPIADPVVKRPRSMRFRFNNGVLMNVDKEPKEELQGPLD